MMLSQLSEDEVGRFGLVDHAAAEVLQSEVVRARSGAHRLEGRREIDVVTSSDDPFRLLDNHTGEQRSLKVVHLLEQTQVDEANRNPLLPVSDHDFGSLVDEGQ